MMMMQTVLILLAQSAPAATVVGDWRLSSPPVTLRVSVTANGGLEGIVLTSHNASDVGKKALQVAPQSPQKWAGTLTMSDTGTSKALALWDGADRLELRLSVLFFTKVLDLQRVKVKP